MTDNIQADVTTTKPTKPTKRLRKMAREPQAAKASTTAAPASSQESGTPSKAAQVLAMLQRSEGATLDQLVAATGWLPHTARAALTGLKKKGHAITSEKIKGGSRVYRASSPAAAITLRTADA